MGSVDRIFTNILKRKTFEINDTKSEVTGRASVNS